MGIINTTTSIRSKLILMAAGALILAVLVISFFMRRLVYDSIVRNKRTTVEILTYSMLHDLRFNTGDDDHDNCQEVIAKYMTYYRIIRRISIFDPGAAINADSDPAAIGQGTGDPEIIAAIRMARPSLSVTRPSRNNLSIRSVSPILQGSRINGAVVIDVSIVDIEQTLSAIDRRIALILALTVAVSSLALYFAVRRVILLRLNRLVAVTDQVASGVYDVRLEDRQKDEIGELAAAFNKMTSDLRLSHQEIADYNKHLEERVRDGTAELQKAYEELKSAQSQLVHNEKMASLGVLIAGVAHEINTPVGAILNVSRHLQRRIASLPRALEIFREEESVPLEKSIRCLESMITAAGSPQAKPSLAEARSLEARLKGQGVQNPRGLADLLCRFNFTEPAEIDRYLECFRSPSLLTLAESFASIAQTAMISETSSKKIGEIVRALKYYAYADRDRVEPIQINESIEIALVLLRNSLKNRVTVRTEFTPDLPLINCTSEIHQVWTNLLKNAADAVAEMGEDHEGEIVISTRREEGSLVVTVTDNGIGIPEDALDKIFDPFVTTKDIGKGTGLGLSISSGIIKKLKGTIRVHSRRGHTVFETILPLEQAGEPAGPIPDLEAA